MTLLSDNRGYADILDSTSKVKYCFQQMSMNSSIPTSNAETQKVGITERDSRRKLRNFIDVMAADVFESEVAGATFSDSDSAPVPKSLNPGPCPGLEIFQMSESASSSDSGYNRGNRKLPMV